VWLIDTYMGRPHAAASYLVRGERDAAFIETGTARALPHLLAALRALGLERDQVAYVIVTHVHLDHAGGAGALLADLPRAKLVVHPRGAKHMIDPSKLVAGATEVYGPEELARTYGTIVPVSPERVIEAPEGASIDLGRRRLVFQDAPGHALHHFVVFDEQTRGFFTGDTFGLSYPELNATRGPFIFPTTTPVQFDPPTLKSSVGRMLAARPERMYLTHYGMLEGGLTDLGAELCRLIDAHVALASAAKSTPDRHAALRAGITSLLLDELERRGSTLSREDTLALWELDIELNAQGLGVWLDKQAKR
jgi:glyoxylase-like metal-dependent hydrolase (beta-lactamase superfamily II)